MRIALAQISPALGDVERNLALHERTVLEAAARGAEVVLFPELSLTGYRLRDMVPRRALRLDVPSERLDRLLRLSERADVVLGLVEESDDLRYYNAAAYLSEGRVVAVHRKCYLPTYGMFDEGRDFAAGSAFRAFDTRHGRLGMAICEDLWHTSSATILAQDGADALLVLSAGPTKGIGSGTRLASVETWEELARVTARFLTVFVAYSNRVGFEDGVNFGGGSFVMDPAGERLAVAAAVDPDLVTVEMDRRRLRSARASYPLLRDERLDLVLGELDRIRRRRRRLDDEDDDG